MCTWIEEAYILNMNRNIDIRSVYRIEYIIYTSIIAKVQIMNGE